MIRQIVCSIVLVSVCLNEAFSAPKARLWNEVSPPETVSTDKLKELAPFVFPAIYLPTLDEMLRRRGFHYSGKTARGSFRYEQTVLSGRYGIFVDLFGEGDRIGLAQVFESRPRFTLEDMTGSTLATQMLGLAVAVVKLIVNVPDDMSQDRFDRAMNTLAPTTSQLNTEFASRAVGVGGKTTPWTVIRSNRLDTEDPNRVFVYTTLLAIPIRASEDTDWCQAISEAALLGAPLTAITDRFGGSLGSEKSLSGFGYSQFFETYLRVPLQGTDKLFLHQLTASFWVTRENKVLGIVVPQLGMREGGAQWPISVFLSQTARTGTTWIAHEDSELSQRAQKANPSFRVFHIVLSSECPTRVAFVAATLRGYPETFSSLCCLFSVMKFRLRHRAQTVEH